MLALAVSAGGWAVFHTGQGKFKLANLAGSAIKNIVSPDVPLKGKDRGRTNMLVYGMTKDGLRTDSVMLVSYYWKEKKLVTLNIPRDLYVYDGYENAKLGEVYSYAKARKPHDSTYPDTFVASLISKEYNLPVDYWTQVNMQGEVDFINALGGIDVTAPDAFTDYKYPTWDYSGYIRPAPHFNAGPQHMNGDTALIYSRSRHSLDNNEGTDFARSKRQALVIQAIMTKVKAQGIVGNFADISKYLNILGNNITTSMSTDEMVSFAKTLKGINPNQDYVKAAWETGNGFLCDSSTPAGAYITLYGVTGSCGVGVNGHEDSKYREMALYFVKNLLASAPQSPTDFVATASGALGYTPSATVKKEAATITVLNAGAPSGYAKKEADTLTAKGFNILSFGNASQLSKTTTIVDNTQGGKPGTLAMLQNVLGASTSTQPATTAGSADFVILLGSDLVK
ncbi:MAG TPA: LCP family protein [Candidatus Saccharimonadia bacterium]|jgi:LCP family protein required for cell wall assembly